MKHITGQSLFFAVVITLLMAPVFAEPMKQDNVHIKTWNTFASNILGLHKSTIAGKQPRKTSRTGGYSGNKEFYIEEQFFLGKNHISTIQWEKENPGNMHAIEFFIYDDKGRVIRDYIAAYLPTYRNAPIQTLVSLHQYNDKLHAFRSFDATGYRVVERCSGTLKGKPFEMLLDEDEIAEAVGDDAGVMASAEYQACFNGLPLKAGKYLTPQ